MRRLFIIENKWRQGGQFYRPIGAPARGLLCWKFGRRHWNRQYDRHTYINKTEIVRKRR